MQIDAEHMSNEAAYQLTPNGFSDPKDSHI